MTDRPGSANASTPAASLAALRRAGHRHRWPYSDVIVLPGKEPIEIDYPCRCGWLRAEVEEATHD